MEVVDITSVKVIWNGKDVTADVSKYLSSVSFTDREEAMADDATFTFDNTSAIWSNEWYPSEGDTIQFYIGSTDCGLYQVDEITLSGPPDTIQLKTVAAGITKALRTRNNKAFESQNLKQIATFYCKKHGFKLIDNSSMLSQINLERKTQENQTDLAFLSELAKEYGFVFKIRSNQLVFTSAYDLDAQPPVKHIDKTEVGSYSITEKTYDTYSSAEIKVRNKNQGKLVKSSTVNLSGGVKDVYIVKGSATTPSQAEAKTKAGLYNKNKYKQVCTLNDLPGDAMLVSGVNFNLTGFGEGSGVYHITESTHSIESTYTMSLTLRKTGTLPKPKRIPKVVKVETQKEEVFTTLNETEE